MSTLKEEIIKRVEEMDAESLRSVVIIMRDGKDTESYVKGKGMDLLEAFVQSLEGNVAFRYLFFAALKYAGGVLKKREGGEE